MWFVLLFCALLRFPECYSYGSNDGYLQDIDPDWAMISGRINQPKCIDIPSNLTLCQNLGYHQMRLPNLLDHDTINEAIQQSKSWISLLGVECHPDTKLFLCSLFSPVCLDRKIYPCRSLCNAVKNGCEQTMLFYNYSWPDMVKCDQFPEDSDLCIQPLHNVSTAHNLCSACRQPATVEGLVDGFCRSTYVVRAKVKQIKHQNEKKILVLERRKKFFKKNGLSKKDKKSLSPYIQGGIHCDCDRINVTLNEKYIIMGNNTSPGEFTAMYIAKWRKERDFRKAVKLMRKKGICSKPLDIGESEHQGKGGKGKGGKKGKGKKGKKGKGKKGKKRKGKKGKGKKGKKGKGKKGKGKKKNRKRKGKKGGKGRNVVSPPS
ncbi:secreted frizzled-related protein 5-like [Saccostrea cucullata]|uniref:secreted frizzled-related protein 5-like n=1 Tax=Saccostrea cuccullata TaxID=36930 RepID=UPI002ED2468B